MDSMHKNSEKKNAENSLSNKYRRPDTQNAKAGEHKDNIHLEVTTSQLLNRNLINENCDPKNEVDDLKRELEAERKARAKAEDAITELKETFEKRKLRYDKEREAHLETIECLEESVKSIKEHKDSVLLEKISFLENELARVNVELSAFSFESSKHAQSDPPAAECKPKKSENSVIINLGLHMILSGQRQMNLDGIMSLFTEAYSQEDINDNDNDAWKKCFVKVAACEMNGKMENISSAAERLLNNEHTQQFQDILKGVHVEKTKFHEDEVKCLELICNAMCIEFTAS